jgi:hypothetical protein
MEMKQEKERTYVDLGREFYPDEMDAFSMSCMHGWGVRHFFMRFLLISSGFRKNPADRKRVVACQLWRITELRRQFDAVMKKLEMHAMHTKPRRGTPEFVFYLNKGLVLQGTARMLQEEIKLIEAVMSNHIVG